MLLPLQWPGDVQFGGAPSPPAAVCRVRAGFRWLHGAHPALWGAFGVASLHPPSSQPFPAPWQGQGPLTWGCAGPHHTRMRLRLRRLSSPVAMPVITDLSSCNNTAERAVGGWQHAQPGDIFAVTGTPLPGFEATTAKGTAAPGDHQRL